MNITLGSGKPSYRPKFSQIESGRARSRTQKILCSQSLCHLSKGEWPSREAG